jgi:hypothetical protein
METVILKAKSRAEVANEYGINVRTLFRWIKKSNTMIPNGLIKPYHLQLIYNAFGIPRRPKITHVS